MLDGLSLNNLEEYQIQMLLAERTNHLNGPVNDLAVVDYTEAILCGILCELITLGKIKWRKEFDYRFRIKEL
ncbi:MAG: hypothetical protein GY714_12300 [Desulfobacterales bacterium]|nr:hypothetical protein [Desulfobacterales bacterium]